MRYVVYADNEFVRTYKRWAWVEKWLTKQSLLDEPPEVTIRVENTHHGWSVWRNLYPWFGKGVMGNKIWEL
jgi:hypothetical protein